MKVNLGSFVKSLRFHKKTILLITITAVTTLIVSSLISVLLSRISNMEIPSIGTIRFEGVEGYWDKNLTNKTGLKAPYNWGVIWPGATNNLTLYLRSVSNIDIKFEHTEGNWTFYNSKAENVTTPSDSTDYMRLTWNYDNSTVHPGQIVQVTLTLQASSTFGFIRFLIDKDVKSFSFDLLIAPSEHS